MTDFDSSVLNKLKKEGNEFFKRKSYKDAILRYYAVLEHVGLLSNQQIVSKDEEQILLDALRVNTIKNISMIHYKMKEWTKCIDKCIHVLKLIKHDEKTYFRMGVSFKQIGYPQMATFYLQKSMKLSTNPSIIKSIQKEINTMDMKPAKLTKCTHDTPIQIDDSVKHKLGFKETPLFKLVSFNFKGYGWIAKTKIKAGTIICIEQPLMMLNMNPQQDPITQWRMMYNQCPQIQQKYVQELHNNREISVSALEMCEAIYRMDPFMIIFNKITSNVYKLMRKRGDEVDVVFNMVSRMNHSCDPNIKLEWKNAKEIKVVALRDIDKNEEITSTYLGWETVKKMNVIQRRETLIRKFAFYCDCSRCLEDYKNI